MNTPVTFTVSGVGSAQVDHYEWTFDDGTRAASDDGRRRSTQTFTTQGLKNVRVDVFGVGGGKIGTAPRPRIRRAVDGLRVSATYSSADGAAILDRIAARRPADAGLPNTKNARRAGERFSMYPSYLRWKARSISTSRVKPARSNRRAPPRRVRPDQVAVDRIALVVGVQPRERLPRRRVFLPAVHVEREHRAEDRVLAERRDIAVQERVVTGHRREAGEVGVELVRDSGARRRRGRRAGRTSSAASSERMSPWWIRARTRSDARSIAIALMSIPSASTPRSCRHSRTAPAAQPSSSAARRRERRQHLGHQPLVEVHVEDPHAGLLVVAVADDRVLEPVGVGRRRRLVDEDRLPARAIDGAPVALGAQRRRDWAARSARPGASVRLNSSERMMSRKTALRRTPWRSTPR